MKYYIILTGILLFTLSSCEDLLDIPSETELSTGSFFQTREDFEKAVNGVYEPLRAFYEVGANAGSGAMVMGEMHSDNVRYSYNLAFRATISQEDIADFIYDPANAAVTLRYQTSYLIIGRANEVLARIDDTDFDQAFKDNIKGQSLFLRAFSYFDLVQYYGEVPLHLQPSTSFDDVALPLSSVDDVYAQIIQDASEAASLLPSVEDQAPGKATSGTANTLLGNVYVVLEEWANAETALKKVTGYSLLSDYAEVFLPGNKGNSEMIFEAQFAQSAPQFASNFMFWFWPQPITAAEITTIYEDNGIAPPADIQARSQGGIMIPSPDLVAAYEAGDRRLDATIGFGMANGIMMPYAKKYLQPADNFLREDTNWPIYRYAEVLLFLAEALHNQGNDAEALTYVNQVRDRVGLAPLASLTDDDILQERRVELALENKRWLDLVRTDRVEEVIRPYGDRIRANPEDYYFPADVELRPSAFQDFSKTFPLPAAEALLSPYF
uniref:RagB/SusD family nutrient uptake outer membrane protein n=1 Tax=Roseihalotalea indica TaxID=2867963 RepID=A0AA49GLM2_9BACT|nr:RagB/SusD family nutrient uptake outer membrane protein [Tunicatimonas sp. TK19036]